MRRRLHRKDFTDFSFEDFSFEDLPEGCTWVMSSLNYDCIRNIADRCSFRDLSTLSKIPGRWNEAVGDILRSRVSAAAGKLNQPPPDLSRVPLRTLLDMNKFRCATCGKSLSIAYGYLMGFCFLSCDD